MSDNNTLTVTASGDREIVIERTFNAPRALVFEALTQPELLKRWLLGPPGWTMTECESDLTVGGNFRHIWQHGDGNQLAMCGQYREIVPPERIVRTERFEVGCEPQAGEQLATLVLTEHNAHTLMTIIVVFPSKEARDGAIASGMEHGAAASYDRLAEVIAG
jgi:uncharacterized protein YndB with AHSA1/START domain